MSAMRQWNSGVDSLLFLLFCLNTFKQQLPFSVKQKITALKHLNIRGFWVGPNILISDLANVKLRVRYCPDKTCLNLELTRHF